MTKVLLVIPAYNEEEAIVHTVRQIQCAQFSPELAVDYIVVNDGSTDNTEALCIKNHIPCISLIQNLGIGGAVQTGYIYALMVEKKYDIAVQFDGDGQHDIASLDNLVAPIAEGRCDFTLGSRFMDDSSSFHSTALRRAGIRYLSFLIRLVTGRKLADVTSGYRAAGRQVIEYLSQNYPVDYPEPESLVLLCRHGFRICEVPVNMFERTGGQSSIRSFKSIYYMMKVTMAVLCAAMRKKERDK